MKKLIYLLLVFPLVDITYASEPSVQSVFQLINDWRRLHPFGCLHSVFQTGGLRGDSYYYYTASQWRSLNCYARPVKFKEVIFTDANDQIMAYFPVTSVLLNLPEGPEQRFLQLMDHTSPLSLARVARLGASARLISGLAPLQVEIAFSMPEVQATTNSTFSILLTVDKQGRLTSCEYDFKGCQTVFDFEYMNLNLEQINLRMSLPAIQARGGQPGNYSEAIKHEASASFMSAEDADGEPH